jgi:hypothetical protein
MARDDVDAITHHAQERALAPDQAMLFRNFVELYAKLATLGMQRSATSAREPEQTITVSARG